MAVIFNFTGQYAVNQGADWFATFFYQAPDGTPIDMTGFTGALQVRSFPQDTTAVLTLTTANDGIIITGVEGRVDVHATNTQTTVIDEGFYVYDLEVTDVPNGGTVTRLSQGQFEVSAQVTRT